MANNDQGGRERRKYERVLVHPDQDSLRVKIVGHGPTQIFDMSYQGAALGQPKNRPISDTTAPLNLEFSTEIDQAVVPVRVVRLTEELVAVEFTNVPVPARIIVDRVVTDRIVGLNFRLVEPEHYAVDQDFNYWFHGPKETNLYLWGASQLERAQFDTPLGSVIYEDDIFLIETQRIGGKPGLNNHQMRAKALAVLEQVKSELAPFVEFRDRVREQQHGV